MVGQRPIPKKMCFIIFLNILSTGPIFDWTRLSQSELDAKCNLNVQIKLNRKLFIYINRVVGIRNVGTLT